MKLTYTQIALIFLFAIINLYTTCYKPGFITPTYEFHEKIELFPARKLYKPGDTLWLYYKNPTKTLSDVPSGKSIKADSAAMQFEMKISNRYGIPPTPANGSFEVSSVGTTTVQQMSDTVRTLIYSLMGCANGLDLRLAIIPKYKGVYSLDLSVISMTVQSCSTRTEQFPFSIVEYQFNVPDCNKDVYESIPAGLPNSPTQNISSLIDAKKVFVFKVE